MGGILKSLREGRRRGVVFDVSERCKQAKRGKAHAKAKHGEINQCIKYKKAILNVKCINSVLLQEIVHSSGSLGTPSAPNCIP